MTTIVERRLALDFPDGWEQVVAYDRPGSFYRRIIEKGGVQHVRGIDIVCRLPGEPARLQFIEVKDDRRREMEAGPRHAELFITVMQKVAGTLAGLLLAERLAESSLTAQACLSQSPGIEVVLLLVEPSEPLSVPPDDTIEYPLHRLARRERVVNLDQRLTAKLYQWVLAFNLYNLSNRPPAPWQVRDLST